MKRALIHKQSPMNTVQNRIAAPKIQGSSTQPARRLSPHFPLVNITYLHQYYHAQSSKTAEHAPYICIHCSCKLRLIPYWPSFGACVLCSAFVTNEQLLESFSLAFTFDTLMLNQEMTTFMPILTFSLSRYILRYARRSRTRADR